MALVLLCGQPCSGKSSITAYLSKELQEENLTVKLIDEPSLNLVRDECYKDMPNEKNLRGLLRSSVDRTVSKDNIVIVDSLNNIKGYRYELWCIARAAGIRYCVIYCRVSGEKCREWNSLRREEGKPCYPDTIMEDLLCRFEEPIGHNRWDSPLFEVDPTDKTQESEVISRVVAFLRGKSTFGKHQRGHQQLEPTIATQNSAASSSSRLHSMDKAVQEVISSVMEAQKIGGWQPGLEVHMGPQFPVIPLSRPLGIPELRRLKTTFLKLANHSSLMARGPPSDPISSKRLFAEYLIRELEGSAS